MDGTVCVPEPADVFHKGTEENEHSIVPREEAGPGMEWEDPAWNFMNYYCMFCPQKGRKESSFLSSTCLLDRQSLCSFLRDSG